MFLICRNGRFISARRSEFDDECFQFQKYAQVVTKSKFKSCFLKTQKVVHQKEKKRLKFRQLKEQYQGLVLKHTFAKAVRDRIRVTKYEQREVPKIMAQNLDNSLAMIIRSRIRILEHEKP